MTWRTATCIRPRCTRIARARHLCAAHHDEYSRRRRASGWPDWYVDGAPVVDHLGALAAAGIGYRRAAELAGVHADTVARIGKRHKLITAETAAKLLRIPIPASPFAASSPGYKIPVLGARRRMRALCALGYTNRYLAERLGVHQAGLARLYGVARGNSQRYVTAELARRVDALFRELQLQVGPNDRARDRARKRGWAPPLAWDEDTIDDPIARPHFGGRRKVAFIERYRDARDVGQTDVQIAEAFGIKLESLERQLFRAGIREAS